MALLDFAGAPHGGMQRHLPEWQSQPRITPTAIIDHSIVGSGENAFGLFRDRSVLESHFIVCGAGDQVDGQIWQLMDTGRQADANLDANGYAISIETGDQGDPDRQLWTQAQLRSLIWLHRELCRVHPTIPGRRSRSCADPAGHGFHTLHGAPSCWTPVSKSCPGAVRKRQWFDVLLPAYLAGQPLEDDMFEQKDRDQLAAIHAALTVPGTTSPEEAVNLLFSRVRTIEKAVLTAAAADLANATPDQVQALGKAIADNLEIKGHPELAGSGTLNITLAPTLPPASP